METDRETLFFRPVGLKPSIVEAASRVQLSFSGGRLMLNNPTPYHITPTELQLTQAGASRVVKEIPMLAPFSQVDVSLDNPSFQSGVDSARLSYINDFGGIGQARLAIP